MKVCSCPKQVPPPTEDYENFDRDKMEADESAHKAILKAYLVSIGYNGPRTGEILAEPCADGAALYMFADGGKKSALIHLPYGDGWNSPNVQHLPKAEILRRLDMGKAHAALFQKTGDFYAGLKPGQVVHYDNGFNTYVRCEAVTTPEGMKLRPMALVGAWKAYDLPKWTAWGEIDYGYNARQIRDGALFTPHESNIYEARRDPKKLNPVALSPIVLEPPARTPEEIAGHAICAKWNAVRKALDVAEDGDSCEAAMSRAKAILG